MSAELETLEYQSFELVEGLIKGWVANASNTARSGGFNAETVQVMQWLYLAEPHLITSKIFAALKLSGWTAPEGFIAVDYSKEAGK